MAHSILKSFLRFPSSSSFSFTKSAATSLCSSSGETDCGREYLMMSDNQLISQCEMDAFEASGPGGQHRNKRESAVHLKHLPTGRVMLQKHHG